MAVFVGVSALAAGALGWVGSLATGWFAPSPNSRGYDVATSSSLTVVVNKQRPLSPLDYYPAQISDFNLTPKASAAFAKMRSSMAKAGAGDLVVVSAFRDYATQLETFTKYTSDLGETAGENRAAKPGFSEHQTGLAADIAATGQSCAIKICFAQTKAGRWLAKNSWRFGFILRYPKGASEITGYQFEPWHYRFVGPQLAREMHKAKVAVLETYLNLGPAPNY
ncbi:MAG: hypothetical protein RL196_474 [Actinomycetota bacterium]